MGVNPLCGDLVSFCSCICKICSSGNYLTFRRVFEDGASLNSKGFASSLIGGSANVHAFRHMTLCLSSQSRTKLYQRSGGKYLSRLETGIGVALLFIVCCGS